MPELPEVETTRKGLAPHIEGRKIRKLITRRDGLRYPFPNGFDSVEERTVENLSRRAKYLIFDLGGFGLLGHLGMSGSYRIAPLETPYKKHDHFALLFDQHQIIYHDPRRFGAVDLWHAEYETHPWLAKLGPEPLGNRFSGEVLFTALHARKSPIKSALLNQNIVAGLGNIYVCEALFSAKISPFARSCDLSAEDCARLYEAIVDALRRAIESGGSTLRDFLQASGETGYFQHQFMVYDQAGLLCANACGAEIIRATQNGRSSFFCPVCQKQ